MKKFITLLLTLTLLIFLISFSATPVLAAEEPASAEESTPKTGDHTEIITAVMLLSAAVVVTLVGHKLEQKILV